MIGFGCYVLALFSLTSDAAAGQRPRFEPLPTCSDCVPREDIFSPGIGFHLTTSYATAAIRYYNGTVLNIGKVDASYEYKELMVRLSDPSSKPLCTGHGNAWEEIKCSLPRARRRWNKLRGRPATPEVGIVAALIGELKVTVKSTLGKGTMKKILPAVTELPGLTFEDLRDAMEYAGLIMLVTHKHIGAIVSETSAAFAGMGYGLCNYYADPDACEDEEADMPWSFILSLSFSHSTFSAGYTFMREAYVSLLEKSSTHSDLGLKSLPNSEHDRSQYWQRIREAIIDVGRASPRRLTTLLLLGEDAGNPDFVKTVQDALQELVSSSGSKVSGGLWDQRSSKIDPLYIAARGVAEFAKRAQEAPAGCKEPARCAKNRHPPGVYADQIVFAGDL